MEDNSSQELIAEGNRYRNVKKRKLLWLKPDKYYVTRKGSRLTSAQSYNTGLYGVRYILLTLDNNLSADPQNVTGAYVIIMLVYRRLLTRCLHGKAAV